MNELDLFTFWFDEKQKDYVIIKRKGNSPLNGTIPINFIKGHYQQARDKVIAEKVIEEKLQTINTEGMDKHKAKSIAREIMKTIREIEG